MSDHDDLKDLVTQLDLPAPPEHRVEAMRAALLKAAVDDRHVVKPRWPFVAGGFGAGAFAAAATAVIVMHGHHAPAVVTEERAQIEASTAADFDRTITRGSNGTDEVVRLHAGRISLAVGALPGNDHVRVAAGNGEIEGTGLYEVAVAHDAIEEVTVRDGTARVRITGATPVFLAAGQVWHAPVVAVELTPAPTPMIRDEHAGPSRPNRDAPVAVAKPIDAPATRPPDKVPDKVIDHVSNAPVLPELTPQPEVTPAPSTPASGAAALPARPPSTNAELERHFTAGYRLLQQNQPADAARELERAAAAGGDDPLAGDARYFQAIALTRAGRKTEAERALVDFLDRSPHAVRRGRAAVMLARLVAERGDTAAARAWFEAALGDPDPAVAGAAKAGLASLSP